MERQHTTNLKTLPSCITKVTIRSCILYRRLQQLDPPLILQWLLSTQADEYFKFAVWFVRTYLTSVVIQSGYTTGLSLLCSQAGKIGLLGISPRLLA